MSCNPTPYPITMDQKFKLAIGLTNNSFVIAINGRVITSFPFRDGSHKIFGSATGIEIISSAGLRMEVQGVDHQVMDCNCQGIERFSC